ncbi:MAG: hypothetical protein WCP45_06780 [Verrucomicrobiota bacterium]
MKAVVVGLRIFELALDQGLKPSQAGDPSSPQGWARVVKFP